MFTLVASHTRSGSARAVVAVRQTFSRRDGVLEHTHAVYTVIPVRMRHLRASRDARERCATRIRAVEDARSMP